MNDSEEKQHFVSMEAKLAAIQTEVRLHHEMVKEGFDRLQESYKERDHATRDELTLLAQTVRTVSEWQIGHANTTYHRDLADRLSDVEGNVSTIMELHMEKHLTTSDEERYGLRRDVDKITKRLDDADLVAKARADLVKRQSMTISFLMGLAGSIVGIVVALNIL